MRLYPWYPPLQSDEQKSVVLPPRQVEMLEGYCLGMSDKEIAKKLGITYDTAKTHGKLLKRALGCRDRAHAAALVSSGAVRVNTYRRYSGESAPSRSDQAADRRTQHPDGRRAAAGA